MNTTSQIEGLFETANSAFRKFEQSQVANAGFQKAANDTMKPLLETFGLDPNKFTLLDALEAAYRAGTKAISA